MDLFNQGDLFATNEPKKTEFDLPDADVTLFENFFSPDESNRLYKSLKENIKISPLLQAKSEKDFIERMANYEANR